MILSAIKISSSVKTAEISTRSTAPVPFSVTGRHACSNFLPVLYISHKFFSTWNTCMHNHGCTENLPSIICKCDSIFSIHVRSDIGKHLPFSRVAGYEEFTPIRNGEYFEWIIINIVCLYSYYWLNNCLGLNVRLRKA